MLEGDLETRKSNSECANTLKDIEGAKADLDALYRRRHLIRLWLRDPENAWQTPAALEDRWTRVYGGVTSEKTVFPLEPTIRSASAGNTGAEAVNGASSY